MSDRQRLVGTYLLGFEALRVSVVDGKLLIRLEGVPEELAAGLIGSDDSYVVVGSQMDGATVDFHAGNPAPGGRLGGVIEFVRADDATWSTSGRGLRLAEPEWEAGEVDVYRELADGITESRDGRTLEWHHPWPKWRFVEWLSRQGLFIFHGSPMADLDSFLPRRNSVEIMDQGGTGNRAAVYGTPFGLWAMWFAVIDRSKLKGTIRNGVMTWPDRSSRPVDLYRFTVHKDFVGGDIWRTGTLYILSRADFEPIPFYPGGPVSNEWASTSELKPLARLTIDPADFPFLDDVGSHDDDELIAAEEISDIVMGKVVGARTAPGAILVSLKWDDEIAAIWDEYMNTHRRFNPDVERTLTLEPDGRATMEVRGPEGYLQVYEASLLRAGINLER
ncbi:MAG TPA: hypothetical protein VJQ79_01605 [Acidimicrobiia bacterium]|nr:hypothetical protein [Acidimicrobiia bacterium]